MTDWLDKQINSARGKWCANCAASHTEKGLYCKGCETLRVATIKEMSTEDLLAELNSRSSSTLYVPVQHMREAEYWTEPDETGSRTGLKPLFMTASYSSINDEDKNQIVDIRGSLSALTTTVEFRRQHTFIFDITSLLPMLAERTGDLELADQIRSMIT